MQENLQVVFLRCCPWIVDIGGSSRRVRVPPRPSICDTDSMDPVAFHPPLVLYSTCTTATGVSSSSLALSLYLSCHFLLLTWCPPSPCSRATRTDTLARPHMHTHTPSRHQLLSIHVHPSVSRTSRSTHAAHKNKNKNKATKAKQNQRNQGKCSTTFLYSNCMIRFWHL